MVVDSKEKMKDISQKLTAESDDKDKMDRNKAVIEISDILKEKNKQAFK
jgi:hypothetical protein